MENDLLKYVQPPNESPEEGEDAPMTKEQMMEMMRKDGTLKEGL